jgi:hypothetical protein
MITRDKSKQQEQKQQNVKSKKKRKSDWRSLVDELERRDGYVDRAIIAGPRERRARINK